MGGEDFFVQRGVGIQDLEDRLFERPAARIFACCEDRTEGDVEQLAAWDFVEINAFLSLILKRGQLSNLFERCGDMITGAISLESAPAKFNDFAEQSRSSPRDHTQRF